MIEQTGQCAWAYVAELEAVGRGVNLAIQWGFRSFTVPIDSRMVVSCLDNTTKGRDRVRTKGILEMLIKRCLMVFKVVIAEYQLAVKFNLMPTIEKKADQLTWVAKKCLCYQESESSTEAVTASVVAALDLPAKEAIRAAHLPHHLGVDRTFYLTKRVRSDLTCDMVKRDISWCKVCQRIDPAMRSENLVGLGNLAVEGNWCRVACDTTHYNGTTYLSLVDCGPSRFSIWRRLPNETAANNVANLQQVVIKHGPFAELLLDNSSAFRSAAVEQFAKKWDNFLGFLAAYAPSGNGIVERNHSTIKRIAARGDISPELATLLYNVTP